MVCKVPNYLSLPHLSIKIKFKYDGNLEKCGEVACKFMEVMCYMYISRGGVCIGTSFHEE